MVSGYSQAAHSNSHIFGKGLGIKANDLFIFPLCCDRPGIKGCHSKWDKHEFGVPKSERAGIEAVWIAKTFGAAVDEGVWRMCEKN